MSKRTKTVAAAAEAIATAAAAGGVAVAVHKIVYGKRQVILPGTPFRPADLGLDDKALDQLEAVGAFRAPTPAEATLAGVLLPTAAADTGDTGQTDTGDQGAGGIG